MAGIRLETLTRRYGSIPALDGVSLDFEPGSFTALLGPSGCGKTTLLRLIAGFEAPDEGRILFDGEVVAEAARQVAPEHRGVGVVFQSYALWPHMDVFGNVAYPLKARGVDRGAIGGKVAGALDMVGLAGFDQRRIDELSGGQRQRVALARCLVADSRVVLFDEPLANLDMHLRSSMIEAFREIHQRTGATIVYVTHDQSEALALAGQVAVMDRGRVLQLGSPEEIYRSPANEKVAAFVGRGGIVTAQPLPDRSGRVVIAGWPVEARGAERLAAAGKVLLRPEALSLADAGIAATVVSTIYRGPVHEVWVKLADGEERLVLDCAAAPAVDERVHVTVADAWVIPED